MADVSDYNAVAQAYQKRLQDPNWNVDKKKAQAFSKGADQSGQEDFEEGVKKVGTRLKNAWGALTE